MIKYELRDTKYFKVVETELDRKNLNEMDACLDWFAQNQKKGGRPKNEKGIQDTPLSGKKG